MKLSGFKWKTQCVYQAPLSWQDFGSKLCFLGIRQLLKTPFKYLANQMLFYDFFFFNPTNLLVLSQWYEMNLYLYLVCILLCLNPLGDFLFWTPVSISPHPCLYAWFLPCLWAGMCPQGKFRQIWSSPIVFLFFHTFRVVIKGKLNW